MLNKPDGNILLFLLIKVHALVPEMNEFFYYKAKEPQGSVKGNHSLPRQKGSELRDK